MFNHKGHGKVFIEDGKKFLLLGDERFVFPADMREITVEDFVNIKFFDLSVRAKNALRNFFRDKDALIYVIFERTRAELERTPNCGARTVNEIYQAVKLLAEIYEWTYYFQKQPFYATNVIEPHRKTPPSVVIERAIKTLEKYGYAVVAPDEKAA